MEDFELYNIQAEIKITRTQKNLIEHKQMQEAGKQGEFKKEMGNYGQIDKRKPGREWYHSRLH